MSAETLAVMEHPIMPETDSDRALKIMMRFVMFNSKPSMEESQFLDKFLSLKEGTTAGWFKNTGSTVYGYHP